MRNQFAPNGIRHAFPLLLVTHVAGGLSWGRAAAGSCEREDQPRSGTVLGSGQARAAAQVLNPRNLYLPGASLNGSMEMLNNLQELVCKFQTMGQKTGLRSEISAIMSSDSSWNRHCMHFYYIIF